jgi:hypothetical protein
MRSRRGYSLVAAPPDLCSVAVASLASQAHRRVQPVKNRPATRAGARMRELEKLHSLEFGSKLGTLEGVAVFERLQNGRTCVEPIKAER